MVKLALFGNYPQALKNTLTNISKSSSDFGINLHITTEIFNGNFISIKNRNEFDAAIFWHETDEDFELLLSIIKETKPIFLANPNNYTLEQLQEIEKLGNESRIKIQLACSAAFTDAFLTESPKITKPLIIDFQYFNQNNTNLETLLFDTLLTLIPFVTAGIRKISANSFSVYKSEVDLINTRIEFDNGCLLLINIGNLQSQHIQKCKIYQRNCYFEIDFGSENNILRSEPPTNTSLFNSFDQNELNLSNIEIQLKNFTTHLQALTSINISIENGIKVRGIVRKIMEKIVFYA